jgi:outer membrane protein OmpA-like peptidoglycan-associated protein
MNNKVTGSVLLAAVAMASGCASSPDRIAQFEDAKASYARANADPMIAKHAALELDDADKSLKKADKHWKDGDEKSLIEHYAYIADQQIGIAEHRAKTLDNQEQLEDMKLERKRVQLDVRAGEIERSRQQAEAAKREAEALQQQLAELQATQTERGIVLTLGDVLFDLNKASLKPGASQKIAKVADFMSEYPNKQVVIEGHTDSTGDEHYNQNLSARRADAVKMALVMRGVESYRVMSRGLGESIPVASNANAAGRQQNRRVEIIFENAERPQASFERVTRSY